MEEKSVNQNYQKSVNTRLVRKQIYLHGPISRVEIAHNLGLTTPAIGSIVAPLLSQGLIQETHNNHATLGVGRPRLMLEFVPNAFYVCGIELGPYFTNYVLSDLCGRVIAIRKTSLPIDVYERTIQRLMQEIPLFLQENNVSSEKLLGIGLVMPGLVDGDEGQIFTTFREGWTDHDPTLDLSHTLGVPVYIENNVRAKVICSEIFDKMVTKEPFAYLSVYYGIACQMIVGDRVLYGDNAAAGEIGHMVVHRNGPVCPTCGNRGCLEAVAGERAILSRCREAMLSTPGCRLHQYCTSADDLTMEAVLTAQQDGDPIVEEILADVLDYLGIALANIINLISPRAVVVDGRIFSLERNREMLLRVAERNMFLVHRSRKKVKFLEFDPLRGAKGAAAVVVKEFINNG